MDPREYPLVPHLEDAVRGKIRRVLMAGRDFRDLPEQEGRFMVVGRREPLGQFAVSQERG